MLILPSRVPLMSRQNYRLEFTAAFFMPFLLIVFEGSVISVLVRIAFEGHVDPKLLNFITGAVAVVPALSNLLSFVWVRLSHGVNKVRFVTSLHAVMAAMGLGVALVPLNDAGLIILALLVLFGRACWSGVTTLRSTIWKQNYPDGSRAKITGPFAMITVLMLAGLGYGLGELMDADDRAFRVLVPVGCVMGMVGRYFWTRIRVRGEAAMLLGEKAADRKEGPSFNPVRMIDVLLKDRSYAAFMLCQFLLGMGNILAMTLLAILLREIFSADYNQGMLVSTVITFVVMPFAIPLWAKLFDKVHIVKFRAIHSWVFVVGLTVLLIAVHTETFWLLFVFSALKGIAFGGGVLGWTLGHLDFAPPEKVNQYMGVHVTLTGVRGLLAATLGVQVYEWLGGAEGGGGPAVGICLALTTIGAIGFVMMSRGMDKPRHDPAEDEVANVTGGGS
ncbi:MAG: MFS transporter [Planctomycetota bacterium]